MARPTEPYAAAEWYMKMYRDTDYEDHEERVILLAAAQVYATLAVAKAQTIANRAQGYE